jgi:hypothetical protein
MSIDDRMVLHAPLTTYQLWKFEDWRYWRSRAQIKALISFCAQAQCSGLLSYTGGVLPEEVLENLLSQKVLPVDIVRGIPVWNWCPEHTLSSTDEEDQNVRSEYENYELDKLLGKYDPFRKVFGEKL